MFLTKKIAASSITEVVIAIAVIGLCIGIASLVFVRSTRVTINFQDVKKQTEIQSMLWEKLFLQEDITDIEDVFVERDFTDNDSIETLTFKTNDDKILWQQDWMKR